MSTLPRVIGLGYKARSGKDTVADYLVRRHGYTRIAFADALKRGCMEMFGLTEAQVFGDDKFVVDQFWGTTPAEILQKVGTECMREGYDRQIWVKRVLREILANPTNRYVMSDVRFPNEGDAVKGLGGLTVAVDRDAEKRNDSGRDDSHSSETAMDDYDWDLRLSNNDSLLTLFHKVEQLVLGLPINGRSIERVSSYLRAYHAS